MFIGQWLRSAEKPECISAQTLRARARAAVGAATGPCPGYRLGEVLGDRQRVPDGEVAVDEHRHAAGGLTVATSA